MQNITQQQIKKNNIVNRYLNLKSLPDNINYQSLVSMTYYDNYKGQNPNSPGKNILNIGEQHFTADEGFSYFIDFLNNLIKKNSHLNSCLDFVFEHSYTDEYKYFQNKNLTDLGSVQNSSMYTMHGLRRLFDNKRRLKGFRVHETDTRLGFEGFYSSIIYLLRYLEEMDDFFVKSNGFVYTVGAFIYNIDNEKIINKREIQSEFWEMFILIEKEGILKKNQASIFQKILAQHTNLSQQDRKYYENQIRNSYSRNVMEFFESVLGYMIYDWGFNDKIEFQENINEIDSELYLNLSPKGYYDYLERKMDKNNVEKEILRYKFMDKKFAKQLDNIDPDYFLDNPKDLIFLYIFVKNINRLSTLLFYDIQTISRVFRKFDDGKGRFKSCDEENKSLRNIIIYSGNTHTQNINEFLGNLPRLRLLSEPISYKFRKQYFEKMDTKEVSPKLSFGNFRLLDGSQLQFPTNFDYFGYNRKIIDKLKQEFNVQNYLQIKNKLMQKQEERKIKQRQKRQLQEKVKIQRQRQRNKKYRMELNQFGKEFKDFNGPGIFTGTLINSKPNKGEIQFENGNHFKGKYLEKFDSLYGVLTFTDGTKLKGRVERDDKKKYDGKLFINNEDYIESVFDSDFNIAQSEFTEFKIDNNEYTYFHENKMLRAPEQFEDKVSEQKLNQLGKQLFQKKNINYKVLKQFSDKWRRQYEF
jgi:hypothetical protein